MNSRTAFTLIELLITVAIVAILATITILALNPAELLRRARDSNRISDLSTLNTALGLFELNAAGGFMGTSTFVYVSIPDTSAACANLGLPSLPTGYTYACATEQNYRKIDGTGWIPVNFTAVAYGSPLSALPVDPINTAASWDYYTYTAGGFWKLTSRLESSRQITKAGQDGGSDPALLEAGSDLTLAPFVGGLVGWWKFDEGSGTTAADSSGYGANMTVYPSSNIITWVNGKIGGGLQYDPGATTACTNGGFGIYGPMAAQNLDLPAGNFSVAWWDNYGAGRVAAFHILTGNNCGGYSGIWSSGSSVQTCAAGSINTSFTYSAGSTGTWHMYAYIFDRANNTQYMYVDGVQKKSGALNGNSYGSVSTANYAMNIGIYQYNCVDAARGTTMDDFRIYKRALSAAEVQAMYDATK